MKFINYLNLLIKKYKVTNKEILEAFAENPSIKTDKTNLSKKLADLRTFKGEELSEIIKIMRPAESELSKLNRLFKAYQFGEKEFEDVKMIKEYIENFKNDDIYMSAKNEVNLNDVSEIRSGEQLGDVLFSIISDAWKKNKIRILCQSDYKKISDTIIYLSKSQHFNVEQIVCFDNETEINGNSYNIAILDVMNKIIINNPLYSVKYYYDNIHTVSSGYVAFPYFVIAGDYLLLISHNYEYGYLTNDKSIIQVYNEEFKRLFNQSHNLFTVLHDDVEYAQKCFEMDIKTKKELYTLQFHPCVVFNYDRTITEEAIRDDFPNKSQFLELLTERWQKLRDIKSYHLHSEDGVKDFMETGRVVDMSSDIFNPVPKNQRNFLLEKIKIQKNIVSAKVNSEFLKIPYAITIACYDHGLVMINYNRKNGIRLIVEERSLYNSMMSFFRYLVNFEIENKHGYTALNMHTGGKDNGN